MIGSVIVDGVFLGALLTLASLGLTLAYAVFRFPNFAHGDLLTVGAYAAWAGASVTAGGMAAGASPTLVLASGALAAVIVCTGIILLADSLVLRPLLARRRTGSVIIAAFAIGLLLRNVLTLVFGSDEIGLDRGIELAEPVAVWSGLVFGRLTMTERGIILSLVPLLAVLHLWLHHTAFGRDLRAFAENPDLAGLCGLAVPPLRRLAWALCGLLCGLAGFALVLLGPVQAGSGSEFMLPALAVVVLGGVGSVWGVVGGSLLLGLVEALIVHLGFADWRQLAAFAVVILVLSLRPARLVGQS